ncbi:F-actin-monooxygenase Mical isoform X3 [Eupeodes corollae]|uniref:F-actin-monooxygenase Mical isoform X3 n=1 Tax=Eupeodes corollae TaxID=290404 RepID=UPI00249054A1|nr:F-actin-monooxygenase Mical isoform X3 [Eupeodes corollae]
MSRSSNQRQQQQLLAQQQQQMADNDAAAAAAEMFDLFCLATTMRQVLGLHRNICDTIGLRPAPLNEFYPKLKAKIRSWKAQALWKKFDARASHRAYSKGNACTGTRVLVIGAGPCGLRTAIEAQLLGAKVVVVEKRDRISRNNVLHLWPFVITDLRNLGAKKFYGKFCAGSIDHISIRQIQCILLKVALLLGVEVHEGVSFDGTIEPSEGCGWRAAISPEDHAVSHYEFDVLIGADGKRNTLEAFKRKEFRGKLAIAITANFINKKTEAEAKAEEISGVAFIFNQAFFKELYHTTGIDLENIVYYKDETHYFVMTAKKHSLIDKGVIMQDFADPAELLASQNVNTDKLLDYAREAAEFSTKYQMPNLEFAVNHYGKPDVAMFDFTSMFAAESSSRVIVRKNYRLLQCLVGDSLLEPFWPTGSGCARGFLSSMDAAYAIKLWNNPKNSILGVLAQRESIYRLLAQTTPENLQRDIGSYTVDPATRYPNLNRTSVNMYQVKHLIDTDDKSILEHTFMDTNALQASQAETPVRRKRRTGDTLPLSAVLLRWIKAQLHSYEFVQSLNEVSDCFTNGKVLCALINRYRPDLVDFNSIKELSAAESNELAFKILDKELKISKVMSGKDSIELDKIDSKIWLNYLEQICEVFRGEIPHVKHPKLDVSELREKNRNNVPDFSRLLQMSSRKAKSPMQDVADLPHTTQRRSVLDEEKVKRQRKHEPGQAQLDTPRRAKKRRSAEKTTNINSKVALAFKKQAASEKCHFCKQTVYLMEKISTEGLILHRSCLKCHHCHTNLRPGGYAFDRDDPEGRFYCTQHFRLPAKAIRPVVRKPGQRKSTAHGSHAPSGLDAKTPEKPRGITESVVQLDLLDRGQTPERIEFENTDAMSDGEPSEEHIIDENEWSGRNFLQPSADSESDLSSSSDESDDDSESDIFEEANGSPIAQQTLQLATDWIGKQHYSNGNSDDSDDSFYDSSEGLADDGKDDTEGEEIKKAREMRREEVRLLPLPTNLPTDTETENQEQVVVVSPQDGVSVQKNNEVSDSERFKRDSDKISITSQTPPPSKTDIEKIEQGSDRRFSADVDAISEKLYRLNNLMKLNKDIESMAKDNLVKSDIMKKLSLKEKWLLDNSVGEGVKSPALGFPGEKVANKVGVESEATKIEDTKIEAIVKVDEQKEKQQLDITEKPDDKASESVVNGDDNQGDGLNINSSVSPNLTNEDNLTKSTQIQTEEEALKVKTDKIASEKMEIEGILDIVKMMDISYIEPSKEPLPKPVPVETPKPKKKDPGQMIYDAEHKKVASLSDALHQIEVRSFAGTMDTIKAQMVMPTVSQQATLDISKYFPNAKQEKQSSASLNKTQKTLKDVDLTKYFPQSPVPQRKASISIAPGGDKLKKSQTSASNISEIPKAPPRRQKSIAAPSSDKTFSMQEHQLDGAIDIQKAPVVKPVSKKGGIKIVKKIVPKGTKAAKKTATASAAVATPVIAKKKIQDEADKILDEILQSGQDVRSPSIEYQKLFTEEKSPSEDISEKIEKILEETGIDLGLPPNPRKKLQKTKSLGEEEFKRTHDQTLSREDGDRPMGVRKILQRFESMSSIKSDESFKLRKTNLSSTCSSLNRSKESLPSNSLHKSKESLQSSGSLKSNSDSMSDLEKTMEYLKSEWKTEATNFLQKKRDNFYASRDEKKAEAAAEAKKINQPEPQWKHTKYSKFFGIKEKSPEKRKSPTKSGGSGAKRKSPSKILKKSPREEIMKHRKKVESVMSRTASFEEKIKASSGSQNNLTNGLENKVTRRDSVEVVSEKKTNPSAASRIPLVRKDSIGRKDSETNLTDTAQKILSRRGSGSSGLADVLKPPVFKGLRGQQENKNKAENNANDGKNSGIRGSGETLKTILNLVRSGSQTNVNAEFKSNDLSNQTTQNNIVEKLSRRNSLGIEASKAPSDFEAKPVPMKDNRIEGEKVLETEKSSYQEPILTIGREDIKIEQIEESKNEIIENISRKDESSMNDTKKEAEIEIVETLSSLSEEQSENVRAKSSSRNSDQGETLTEKLVQSRKESQTPPKNSSRRGSQAQILAVEAEENITSRLSLEQDDRGEKSKSPLVQSPKESQNELETQVTGDDTNMISQSPPSPKASITKEDSKPPSEAADDVDEIFNKIITELSKDEEEAFNAAQELSLIAIASREEDEAAAAVAEEQPEQPEQQQITEDSENIAEVPEETPNQSRAQSEDSIEELFSHFTNDMLVDVEFDSNDEVVAITPRAVLVNEDEDDNDEEEQQIEKPITVEEAKLKFEPLFPRQAKLTKQNSSTSSSVSPARTEDKTKKIVEKLHPLNMPPSVQDMMKLMIQREESEPRVPVAFPRSMYYELSDETSSSSSKSRTQTPDPSEKTKEPSTKQHLEVVYELAWPKRKRTPSPIPESARPPIKPPAISRENSEQPISRRASEQLIVDSLKNVALVEDESNSRELREKEDSQESPSPAQRGSPKSLPSPPRRNSRISSDLELLENNNPQSISSRRSSKTSLRDNEETILAGSPALLPTPRRGSRASVDSLQNLNERRNSGFFPISPRKGSLSNSEVEEIDKKDEELRGEQKESSISGADNKLEDIASPVLETSREGSKVQRDSHSSSLQPTIQRNDSTASNQIDSTLRSLNETESRSPLRNSPNSDIWRKDSDSSSEKIRRSQDSIEPELQTTARKSSVSPRTEKHQQSSREESQISTKSLSNGEEMVDMRPKMQQPSRESSKASSKSSLQIEENASIRSEMQQSPRENSKASTKSPPKVEKIYNTESSREGSKTSTKSPPRAEGMVNIVDLLNDSSGQRRESESSRKSDSSKSNAPSLPESPQAARARFFGQNQSASSSPRDSKDRLIQSNEPSKEYRDLLRSRLESPSSRNPNQSRERSLEWDMEQLPKSPMPRRKYMALLHNESDKEESPKRSSSIPEPSPPTGNKSAPDIRIPTKRLEEWEIIEQLERERRHALVARDQNYSDQVQEVSSKIEPPKMSAKQENPPLNRLESLDEPHSSKLMEYIKQETLKDSIKSKDDSPRPPSRPRTPQLSKRISNNDLEKQVVEILKSEEPKRPSTPVRSKPPMQKTESVEATYEDFARFTRRSPEKDADPEESDVYESPTASISHHRLANYRHKSQDSASGTYSPTSSLSRSIEHIAPSRPHRNKSSTLPENRVDRDTKYLMDRSKHLRNMKRDFMEEKIAGNNPYLKKVIEAQKVSRQSDEDDDVEVDYTLESYRPKNHTTPRFPTSSSIGGRRRHEPRYPDYTSSTDYTSRRPYNPHPHFSTTSTSSSAGSRNFTDYFKRSPPHYKGGRESSKDSCLIS